MKRISNQDFVEQNNEILHRRIKKVIFPINEELKIQLLAMREYIVDSLDEEKCEKYNLSPAVGIAANQIGIDARAFVLYIEDENEKIIFDEIIINPVILSHSAQESFISAGEGCLSVKETHGGYIYRKRKIKVSFFTLNNEKKIMELDGFISVAFQHEMDHLNGILYIDRIDQQNPLKRKEDALEI